MENAVDALKIAFAVLVFVIAITVLFMIVTTIRTASDASLHYADETTYQAHYKGTNSLKRVVSKSDVVSSLYRYYNETMAVTVVIDDKTYVFDLGKETILFNIDSTDTYIQEISSKYGNISKLTTNEQIEDNLAIFIEKILPEGNYSEEFVEIPISGKYLIGEDGTEVVTSSGGKKVYVKYTKQ